MAEIPGVSEAHAASGSTFRVDRVPPHNLDAEEGLLAACLFDGGSEVLTACLEARIKPESFFKPGHQILYQILLDNSQNGKGSDTVAIIDALASRTIETIAWLKARHRLTDPKTSLLEMVGGPTAVLQVANRIETTAHYPHWLEIVREKWLLRRLIGTTSKIAEDAFTQQDRLDHFIDSVEQQILAINEDRIIQQARDFETAIDEASRKINQFLEGQTTSGVLTGFTDIDGMTFGLHPAQMIVVAGRPSMGKTSFGMNIVENAAIPPAGRRPARVLVFSLEMSAEDLAMRMICGRARVSSKRVRDRMISNEQKRDLARAASELKKAPIFVDDSSGLNILELRAKARRVAQQRGGLDLIIIDYLTLISGLDSRTPREQQVAEISRGSKALAKELNVPVIVLSQLNRSSDKEDRDPRISDLRESGAIEQDADVVFLLASNKEGADNPTSSVPQAARTRKVIIAKQRNGPTGEVVMTFLPEFTRFENYVRSSAHAE